MRKEAGGSVGGVLPIDREGFILNSPGPQLPVLRQSRVVGGRRGPGSGQRHSLRAVSPSICSGQAHILTLGASAGGGRFASSLTLRCRMMVRYPESRKAPWH